MATCTLTGYIILGTSTGMSGVNIHAVPYETPAVVQGTSNAISPTPITVLTTSTGYFELELLRNVKFTVTIPEIGFRKTVLVPNVATNSLFALTDILISGDPTPTDQDDVNW